VRDSRRSRFFHLEFEHQVHALSHEFFGVVHRHCGIVAVIENDQLHAGGRRSRYHALRHRLAERHLRTLHRESKAQSTRTRYKPVLPLGVCAR